jgi:hypothetical protein
MAKLTYLIEVEVSVLTTYRIRATSEQRAKTIALDEALFDDSMEEVEEHIERRVTSCIKETE